jgi:uncharacterized phage protein (TIGR01671 family)
MALLGILEQGIFVGPANETDSTQKIKESDQYIGSKDKNGEEIYEGDIVEHRNFIQELLGKYEVRWGVFGFTLYDAKRPEISSYYASPELLEVVGNIYENSELLN